MGVQILMMVDKREQSSRFWDDLRSRLAAAHPSHISTLFPEWSSPAEVERAAYGIGDDGEADLDRMDDSLVSWQVPQDDQEHAEIERWLQEHQAGTVTAVELGGGDWV